MRILPTGLLIAVALFTAGCDRSPESGTPPVPVAAEDLASKASDRAVLPADRLAAAVTLIDRPGGADLLAARYAAGRQRIVQDLLDSLSVERPGQAARLAASLMAVATGEAKIDFEAILLQQGHHAVPALT